MHVFVIGRVYLPKCSVLRRTPLEAAELRGLGWANDGLGVDLRRSSDRRRGFNFCANPALASPHPRPGSTAAGPGSAGCV